MNRNKVKKRNVFEKKKVFEAEEEKSAPNNPIDVTSVGLASFQDFICYTKEDYEKKVDILYNMIKQVFNGINISKEKDDSDIVFFVISSQERTVIFPVYNGYIELAGVNYGFDSKGCIDLLNALSFYLDTPLDKEKIKIEI